MSSPSKSVLLAAARFLLDSDEAEFPIAEIMLFNILMKRRTAEATRRLDAVRQEPSQ